MGGDATIEALIRSSLEESGFEGDENAAIRDLSFYTAELERWNRKINLSGKRTGREIVVDLLLDAFFVYRHVCGESRSVLDMGSGAGVISIPFAILDRTLRVVSVDASTKKMHFQRHVKRALMLDNLALFASRIEDLEPQGVEAVVAKAFGPTVDALNKAGRHLCDEGRVILLKGRYEPEMDVTGFLLEETLRYRLPGSTKEYKLLTYKKVH